MKTTTVLMIATLAAIGALTVVAESNEIPQMPGFPIHMEWESLFTVAWNFRGAVLADLESDGDLEVVFSYQNNFPPDHDAGTIMVWNSDGSEQPGFPVSTIGGAFFAPCVGDLDRDGDLEIVQITVDEDSLARVYVIGDDGLVLPGFPVSAGESSLADGATLANLDGDPNLEVLYVSDHGVHVFEADASEWGDAWPVPLTDSAEGTPAVGDVDNDGQPEIFVLERGLMHLLRTDGSELSGWPRALSVATFAPLSSAALADLDGDHDLEIVVAAWIGEEYEEYRTQIHVLHHDGSPYPGWPQAEEVERTECPPVVTDLDGDGELEILIAAEVLVEHDVDLILGHSAVWAWTSSAVVKAGFPSVASDPTWDVDLLTAADVDGDGLIEVFTNAGGADAISGAGYIHGVDASGRVLPGFPLRPIGGTWLNGPILGDTDGDGDLELAVVSTSDLEPVATNINVYDLSGITHGSYRDWPTFHRANTRGGLFERPQLVVTPEGIDPRPRPSHVE